jgi:hypothetical protein
MTTLTENQYPHIHTVADYAQYEKAVAKFFADNKISGAYGRIDCDAEPYFSWRACDCCNRRLGGNREVYSFPTIDDRIQAEICCDCVYYLEYGQLDDMTMLGIES